MSRFVCNACMDIQLLRSKLQHTRVTKWLFVKGQTLIPWNRRTPDLEPQLLTLRLRTLTLYQRLQTPIPEIPLTLHPINLFPLSYVFGLHVPQENNYIFDYFTFIYVLLIFEQSLYYSMNFYLFGVCKSIHLI